ncbi:hypothetical protein [Mesobacillus harenae]|uniref:hypothetical protein n=1 Tax=Mesobacillus harenae TaxID=2213203 RepID=UPI0015807102|nr:hypothetical protein [Mesobacillus harenae]
MSKNIYNDFQIRELEKNTNVLSTSERSIYYSPKFNLKAVTINKVEKHHRKSLLNRALT